MFGINFNAKIYAAIIGILVLGVIIFSMYARIQLLKSQRDQARVELQQLVSQVQAQNSFIDKWKKESKVYEKKFTEAEKESNKISKKYDVLLRKIKDEANDMDCEEAVQWAVGKADDL